MAKTLREEDLKLNLVVNGDDARKRIIDLESAVKDNQTAVRRLRNERAMLAKQGQTDSARYKELGKQIQALNQTIKQEEAELESLRGELKLEDMTMAELTKLGFTEREILAMGEPVLNFATALGADLSEAAAFSGAALRIFGLDASETEELLGTLALATNKSALDFSYLQTAISIVGPVAKTFGFSVKDTTALLGTLANAGFDASSAATATRNIILNLADSSGKLAKALGEPVRTFPELMAGLKRLNERGVDLATTLELTDKRSVAAFNSFLAGADSAVALRGELEETGGVLQEIADKRMDTVEGAVASLQSAWERFILSLRNNTGWIKNAVLAARNLVQWITPKENPVTQEDIADYVRGLWSIYEVDMAKGEADREAALAEVSRAISEDQAKLEEQLRSAEAKLETTSGLRNKRRWKKEVQNLRDGLNALSYAQQVVNCFQICIFELLITT